MRSARRLRQLPPASALIEVADPLQALGDLAAFWRSLFDHEGRCHYRQQWQDKHQRDGSPVLSSGHFRTLKNPGNFNNLIGLPLSLFQLDRNHQAAVLELGMSEPGEIARLCRNCDPDIGIITNVGPSHLEQLKTLERIAAAKGELFACLGPQDLAIINTDDERVAAMGRTRRPARCSTAACSGQVHAGPIQERGLLRHAVRPSYHGTDQCLCGFMCRAGSLS